MKKFMLLALIIFVLPMCNVYAKDKMTVTLNKCVDGDTAYFNYKGELIKTRFLAIDTPEIGKNEEAYGEEASIYTCSQLKNAKEILLEYDENSNKLDKYGRHLVWVFVDNELLQSKIIKNGYSEIAYLYGDYKYTESLYDDLKYAKENKEGMWNEETNDLETTLTKIIAIIVFLLALYKFIKKQLKKRKITI